MSLIYIRSNTKMKTSYGHAQWVSLLGLMGMSLIWGGCEEPPAEPSLSDAYRIFGVRAEPPIARPEDQVTVTIYDAHPTQDELLYSWSICLYSYGGATGFECVSQEFNNPIPNEDSPRLTIDLGPDGLDLRGKMNAFSELPDVDGQLPSLARGHDIYISILSGLNPTKLTRTIKRLHVIDAPGDEPLAYNPSIKGWSIQSDTYGAQACKRSTYKALLEEENLEDPIEPIEDFLEKGRAYIKQEMSGTGEPCVVRARSKLEVDLNLEIAQDGPLLYEWLAHEASYADPTWAEGSVSDPVVGHYLLPNRTGTMELYFTVRDEHGGFAIGHQNLTLTAIKSTNSF